MAISDLFGTFQCWAKSQQRMLTGQDKLHRAVFCLFYGDRGWERMPVIRKIYAMLFELKTDDGGIRLLIAWLDRFGNSKYLLPAHPDKCLLEMRAGDVVTFRRKDILVVKRLKPWRTSECKDETEYSEIVCGEDWEAGR